MCKGGNQTSTSQTSTSPDPQAYAAYSSLLNRAGNVANTPYTPYTGELVAPVNQQQQTGISGINQYAQAAQPYLQTAGNLALSGATLISAADIARYENPYTQGVVQATQAQFNNQNAQQQQQLLGNAIAQGALGGNRVGIAQAELANQQQLAQAPVLANLQSQGYTQGVNTALTEQQMQQSGAYALGNIGSSVENAGLTGANAQVGAGSLEQQTQQAQDTAAYQQFLNQLAYPFQTTQWLAGIDTGVGSQMGGTSYGVYQQPSPSPFSSILGGLTSGVGMLGATGAFGSAGWLSGALAGRASGGRVPSYANGGIANSEPSTVPESRATLRAQQRQLLGGYRKAQLFPHGTPELPRPQHIGRVETKSGVVHYDPRQIGPDEIRAKAAQGRENDFLNLGPYSKDDVLTRARGGEVPLAVVERQPDGTEVRAAVGTHTTARHQLAHFHRTKTPGNHVGLEDPRTVLAHRIHSHAPQRDIGGAVDPSMMNQGAAQPMGGMPYSGGRSYIPAMGITHGPGAPHASIPSGQPQQQNSLSDQAKQIGALAKEMTDKNNKVGQPMSLTAPNPTLEAAGPMVQDNGIADMSPLGSGSANAVYRRGGVVGLADGGTSNFDDRFMGEQPNAVTADGAVALFNPQPMTADVASFSAHGDNILPYGRFVPNAVSASSAPLNDLVYRVPKDGGASPQIDDLVYRRDPNAPKPEMIPINARSSSTAVGPAPVGVADDRDLGAWALPSDDHNLGAWAAPSSDDRSLGAAFPSAGVTPQAYRQPDVPLPRPRPITGTAPISDETARAYTAPTSGYQDRMTQYGHAIGDVIESGGRYDALGNITDTGDRAYGKYQVMGANIGPWTEQVLGKRLTPTQFLADPQAQDAVFRAKFGQYVNKYGPEGAARAWFAGERGMNNHAAHDINGMTVGEYGHKFSLAAGLGDAGPTTDFAARERASAIVPPAQGSTDGVWSEKPSQPSTTNTASRSPDWSKLGTALMTAGFGMMASRSPFPGVAIGEGALSGLGAYTAATQQEQAANLKQKQLDLESKKLAEEADYHRKHIELQTKPYSEMTAAQKAEHDLKINQQESDAAFKREQLEEQRRQHDLALKTPVLYGETRYGQKLYAIPRPGPNGVEFYPVDPKTGEVAPSPLGMSLKNPSLGTQPVPGQQAPNGMPTTPAVMPVAQTEEQAIAAAPPKEVRAGMPTASAEARNEAYLQFLAQDDPRYAALLKNIANYQMNPAMLFSLRGNRRERAMEDLVTYDPTYDQRRFNQTNRAISGWAQSPEGRATRSLSVVIEHLGTAQDLGHALENGNVQILNSLRNTIKTQFGYEAVPNFETAKQIVADEVAKAVIGGQNAEADRQGLQRQLSAASSPAQLAGVIHTFKELMAGQVIGLRHTYETATGLHNFDDWLTPRTRVEVGKLMEERDAKVRNDQRIGGTNNPEPGGGAQSPAAPATSHTLSAVDQQALTWAKANPTDPRAGVIMKRLGVQ